jgi:hypothetical protein
MDHVLGLNKTKLLLLFFMPLGAFLEFFLDRLSYHYLFQLSKAIVGDHLYKALGLYKTSMLSFGTLQHGRRVLEIFNAEGHV